MTTETRELIGDLLQACQDWGDIFDDVGPKGHLEAGEQLQGLLDELDQTGVKVFVGRRQRKLVLHGRSTPWIEIIIRFTGLSSSAGPAQAADAPA